ncbi:hypothetical protein GF377_11175 [candidate division GN15 bacterium]|nr:hypothetical protein [candidate division GN15 bacterium]
MRVGKFVGILGAVVLGAAFLVSGVAGQVEHSQNPEVTVDMIPWPKLEWGPQTLSFEMTNQGEWLKFITVRTEVGGFDGSYTHPRRVNTEHLILEPQVATVCNAPIEIPANYGICSLWVKIYNVVDTLDDLSLGEVVLEQPFRLNFRAPEQVISYRQEKMSVPPMMGRARALDSEFYRLMFLFLEEGKSFDDMAHIVNADPAYVQQVADDLVRRGYLEQDSLGAYHSRIPVIALPEAEEVRSLVNETSDQLAALVEENLPAMQRAIDSLVDVGAMSPPGRAMFMEGSEILNRRYPLIGCFFLWYTLGEVFITGGDPLQIYQPAHFCQPYIGVYAYIVHGSDYFNGSHLYHAQQMRDDKSIVFGLEPPEIWCSERAMDDRNARQSRNVDWGYQEDVKREAFFFDTSLVHAAMRPLAGGAMDLIGGALEELNTVHASYGHETLDRGTRFWFWNLTATVTMDKLRKQGVIEPEDQKVYHFTRVRN